MTSWHFPHLAFCVAIIVISRATIGYAETDEIALLDPNTEVAVGWNHKTFGIPTSYSNQIVDGRKAIQAAGQKSASGLIREVRFDVREHAILEWSWRVDELPRGADIRSAESDDYGASLSLIFGRPRLFGPDPPTLMYAWASSATPQGSTVVSPHHDGSMRVIVVRSGQEDLGAWLNERRDIVKDFRLAFGDDPPSFVEGFAIWSDSDQTKDAVNAYYGSAIVRHRLSLTERKMQGE